MMIPTPPAYVSCAIRSANLAALRPVLPAFEVWAREQRLARIKRLLTQGATG